MSNIRGRAHTMRSALLAGISATAAMAVVFPFAASAQEAAADEGEVTTVVVTGYRASLQSAINMKRNADVMMDAINAEDIADMPDSNLAESLQRIPGISIDRDNGEGRQISVRGLGGDFTRVRINNMEALSTGGSNDAGSSPNRSRAFDFNAFASELFNSIRVRKTASAETDEGSLGATVDLIAGRPFDYKGDAFAFSVEDSYYVNGKTHNPRMAGLFSKRWADGRLGFLMSVAYAERNSEDDQYRRGVGSSDYTYRGSTWAGDELAGRAGFAAPTGTTFTALIPTTLTGADLAAYKANPANYYDPFEHNPTALAAMTGSNPEAYAQLYPNCAAAVTRPVAEQTPTSPGCNDSLVRFPALPAIEQRDTTTKRLGVTSAFQMQLSANTRFSLDGLYSKFESETTNYQLSPVGLNRNNTNAAYSFGQNVPTATNRTGSVFSEAQRRGLYPNLCTQRAEDELNAAVDCGQSIYGSTAQPGYSFSYNPYNLDTYEYYTNAASPYYTNPASAAYGTYTPGNLAFRDSLIGRPAVKVLAAEVNNGNAEYLELQNIDWRSAADRGAYTTEFAQASAELTHRFSDRFSGVFSAGLSESTNQMTGLLVEFNNMDEQGVFIFDERGSPSMPVFDAGFDAADPNKWGIVKGFSGMRNYTRETINKYKGAKADFDYAFNDNLTFKFGIVGRQFDFSTDQYERQNDTLNPTELEVGVTTASLGSVINFGQGLDVPGGTTTSFFAPSIEAFDRVFGFTCNCVNEYGDFTITRKRNRTTTFAVTEKTQGGYGQVNFNYDVMGRNLFGNIGVRYVETDLSSVGETNAGRAIYGSNKYNDTLPSFNLAWEVWDDVYLRFGASKVMSRPLLGNLSPAVTGISIPSNGDTTGGTINVGNPKLSPFRGTAYDMSAEWYFARGALLTLAVFKKDIESYPQTVLYEAPLSEFLDAEARETLKLQFSLNAAGDAQRAYVDADNPVLARQYRDAPGGTLEGWEFSYQQDLTFLPWYFKNLGIQLNATHIESKLTYILDPGVVTPGTGVVTKPAVYGNGPWLGASPNAVNFTIYYETEKFNARVSASQRDAYYTTYPLASGNCDPGLQANGSACDGPLINETGGSKETLNVDMAMRYQPTKRVAITFEAQNLTDQKSERYAYDNPVVSTYSASGRNFKLGLRYKY
ncbi:MAG: TonB-dependent receptor [Asticcacaulis sp.]